MDISNAYIGDTFHVSGLSSSGKKIFPMVLGKFNPPKTYHGKNGKGRDVTYEAKTDQQWLGCTKNCAVYIDTISRDECKIFDDPLEVAFEASQTYALIPGATVSWWHISKVDDIQLRIN